MTTRFFLALTGLAYIALAAWCALRPEQTSKSVGFTLTPGSGQSEYFVVYGGLQLALGLAFLSPLLNKSYEHPVLLLCLLIHACLAAMRTISFTLYSGISSMTWFFAGIEWTIFLLSAWRFLASR